jgi:hypothetical protein
MAGDAFWVPTEAGYTFDKSAEILQMYGPDRTMFDNPVQIERTR